MKTLLRFLVPILLALSYSRGYAVGPPQQKIAIALDPGGLPRYLDIDAMGNLLLAGSGFGLISTTPQQLFAVALDPSGNPQYLKVDSGGGLITSGGGGGSYTFADSLVNTSGTVTLVGDSATPGNSKYYGTNSGGTLGFYDVGSGSGTVTHNGSLASGYLVIGGTNGTTDIKTDSAIQDDGAGTLTGLVSLTTAAFNVTGTTTFTGLSTNGPVTVSSGVLGSAAYLTNALGGTGGSSASSTGVAQVSSGTWSYSTALANGTTATTQAALSADTKAATDAYADRAGQAAFVGSWASPDTTAAVDTLTLTAPVTIIYTDPTAALRTYQLPAAAAGNKGMAVELIVAATQATYHVNFKPAASDVFYLAGAALTANHYVQDASTTKGDFIIGESDGVHWSFAFGTGYSGTSSWADAASP